MILSIKMIGVARQKKTLTSDPFLFGVKHLLQRHLFPITFPDPTQTFLPLPSLHSLLKTFLRMHFYSLMHPLLGSYSIGYFTRFKLIQESSEQRFHGTFKTCLPQNIKARPLELKLYICLSIYFELI